MKSFITFPVACKAGEFFFVIDLDFQLTEIWGESKNDSKGQVDPLPTLPPAGYVPCTWVQPQDTFSMLYFNQL